MNIYYYKALEALDDFLVASQDRIKDVQWLYHTYDFKDVSDVDIYDLSLSILKSDKHYILYLFYKEKLYYFNLKTGEVSLYTGSEMISKGYASFYDPLFEVIRLKLLNLKSKVVKS